MLKLTRKITVDHSDCVFLWLCVHHYGEKLSNEYQNSFIKLKREGKEEDAQKALKYRLDTDSRRWKIEARLTKIQNDLENLMDNFPVEDHSGSGGGSTGCEGYYLSTY